MSADPMKWTVVIYTETSKKLRDLICIIMTLKFKVLHYQSKLRPLLSANPFDNFFKDGPLADNIFFAISYTSSLIKK